VEIDLGPEEAAEELSVFLVSVRQEAVGEGLRRESFSVGSFGESRAEEELAVCNAGATVLSKTGVTGSLFRFFLFLFTTKVNPSLVSISVVEEDDEGIVEGFNSEPDKASGAFVWLFGDVFHFHTHIHTILPISIRFSSGLRFTRFRKH